MGYRNLFPREIFAELERIQRDMDRNIGRSPSIRGPSKGYPAMNVGTTSGSVEIYAFVPGLEPSSLDVQIEKGMLSISGERNADAVPEGTTVHISERFSGKFRRLVSLPEDIDSGKASASYRDGLLHVSVPRREAVLPRRIEVH